MVRTSRYTSFFFAPLFPSSKSAPMSCHNSSNKVVSGPPFPVFLLSFSGRYTLFKKRPTIFALLINFYCMQRHSLFFFPPPPPPPLCLRSRCSFPHTLRPPPVGLSGRQNSVLFSCDPLKYGPRKKHQPADPHATHFLRSTTLLRFLPVLFS